MAYSGIDCKRIHKEQMRQIAYPLHRFRVQNDDPNPSNTGSRTILGEARARAGAGDRASTSPGVQLEGRLRLRGEEHVREARPRVAGPGHAEHPVLHRSLEMGGLRKSIISALYSQSR